MGREWYGQLAGMGCAGRGQCGQSGGHGEGSKVGLSWARRIGRLVRMYTSFIAGTTWLVRS